MKALSINQPWAWCIVWRKVNKPYNAPTTDKIYTTLSKIRAHSPCVSGYKKLCQSLGGIENYGKNTPITFRQIFESNGYDDTLWCLRAVNPKWYPLWRHFACDAADDVRHLLKDERSTNAIDVARRHADGLATNEERAAAWASQMERLFEYCRTGQRVIRGDKAA